MSTTFDFYRLDEAGIMSYELAEVVGQPQTITLVEWGELVAKVLPNRRLTIKIDFAAAEDTRQWRFGAPAELTYLLEGV